MNHRTLSLSQRAALALVLPALAALSSLACVTTPAPQEMHSGFAVPASEGSVDASKVANGNTLVVIRVKHLAPPAKLAPDATTYVVWIQPRNGDLQNVGALTLNGDLQGELDTLTPHSRFRVVVTPEASGRVAVPAHPPVFTADVERHD